MTFTPQQAEAMISRVNKARSGKSGTIALLDPKKPRSEAVKKQKGTKRSHTEADLQKSCVKWFALQYPQFEYLLFAIANGGSRNVIEASNMKLQGVKAGVADLFLALPCKSNHGVFIELKAPKGKQSRFQKEFQRGVTARGYRYELIYNFDSFKSLIDGQVREAFL